MSENCKNVELDEDLYSRGIKEFFAERLKSSEILKNNSSDHYHYFISYRFPDGVGDLTLQSRTVLNSKVLKKLREMIMEEIKCNEIAILFFCELECDCDDR